MKKRLDSFLVENHYFESRNQAQAWIISGRVLVDNQKIIKSGQPVSSTVKITIKEKPIFVSRGALKLKKALDEFKIDVKDKIALDVGASTGGFTDLLLKSGAKKVIAIDVGYGQFDYSLRNDKRVLLLERTNIRYLAPKKVGLKADLAAVDLSFISIIKVLKNILALLKEKATLLILIKPQFEVGKKLVEKGGIVKKKETHVNLLKNTAKFFLKSNLGIKGLTFSPLRGAKGNIEFLFYLTKGDLRSLDNIEEIAELTVEAVHDMLK